MADPFIGEIRSFGFGFVPQDWLLCDGTVYQVNQFQALAALLGPRFGGDGQHTFGVPNLLGRVVVGAGTGPGLPTIPFATSTGSATATLTYANIGGHAHSAVYQQTQGTAPQIKVSVCNDATKTAQQSPTGNVLSCGMISGGRSSAAFNNYTTNPTPNAVLAGTSIAGGVVSGTVTVTPAGSPTPLPLTTLGPVQAFYFCICTNGEWPQNPN